MKQRVIQVLMVAAGILAVLIIERKTGIFTKVFSKIPFVGEHV